MIKLPHNGHFMKIYGNLFMDKRKKYYRYQISFKIERRNFNPKELLISYEQILICSDIFKCKFHTHFLKMPRSQYVKIPRKVAYDYYDVIY